MALILNLGNNCMIKKLTSHGYIFVYFSGGRLKQGQYEHILIIEKKIGRSLKGQEQVHHINGMKTDNRLGNLILCKNIKEHRRYDKGWIKKSGRWYKICKKCNKLLAVNKKFFYKIPSGRDQGAYQNDCRECQKKSWNKRKFKWSYKFEKCIGCGTQERKHH